MNLSLSDGLAKFAESQARASGQASGAEYIVALVAREQRKHADMDQLESALREGIESGAPIDVNDHYWEQKRHALLARHRAREVAAPTGATASGAIPTGATATGATATAANATGASAARGGKR